MMNVFVTGCDEGERHAGVYQFEFCLPSATCLNCLLQYPVNHHSQDIGKTLYFRHV